MVETTLPQARMTGSGACVFAEFTSEAEARALYNQLPGDMRGFVARGLDRHPLADRKLKSELGARFSPRTNWGVAKLVKAPDFDSGIRGFESFLPSQST